MLRKNRVDKDIIKNLYESNVNEAFNPENEEKNKVIRQALRGPKNFEKNREALKKMGIKADRSEEYGYEPGETIYLHGPNGKHLSVDPDGTDVWHTFGDSRDHYKKELSYKNRHSKHYTKYDTMDFNGDRAKSFDYYNYLTKPENEYQDEVDNANKVKNYKDNKRKKGYNLPDEALTPEEKSLGTRARKYVNLKKTREDLEDKLAGYKDIKDELDKTNDEIKKLHEDEEITTNASEEELERIDYFNQLFASFADKVEKAFSGCRGKFELGKPTGKTDTNINGEPYIAGFTYQIYIGGTIFNFICRCYSKSMGNYCELGFEQNGNSYGGAEDTRAFTVDKAENLLKITQTAWQLVDNFKQVLTSEGMRVNDIRDTDKERAERYK